MELDQEIRLRQIEAQIEKIKQALIDYRPDYFKVAFCEHEREKIRYDAVLGSEKIENKNLEINDSYFYRCKKCGLMLDENGNPKIERT